MSSRTSASLRVSNKLSNAPSMQSGPIIPRFLSFADMPYYVGPAQYVMRCLALRRRAASLIAPGDAVLLRIPGVMGTLIERTALGDGRPFGVEALGDPAQVFQRGGVRSLLSPWLRRRFAGHMRRQCARACAVAYVTQEYLQARYPAADGALETNFTSLALTDVAFCGRAREYECALVPFRLVFVGTLQQMYKGPDVFIDALAMVRAGIEEMPSLDVRAAFVGDGRYRSELERRVGDLGLAEAVTFVGHVSSERVREELDGADAFVLASRTEGLPRAMIEAMARALPCVGTNVGGIPELLGAREMTCVGDAEDLARTLLELARDPARLTRLSSENFEKARAYHIDSVRPRRRAFYEMIRDRTEQWIKQTR